MTCEVAVLNKRGIGLAANSAVTLGERRKVYYTAEKLFQLVFNAPVAIMTYGNADIMGVPWEIIIHMFKQKIGNKTLPKLQDYAAEFLRFVETSADIFTAPLQKKWFQDVVSDYWKNYLGRQLGETQSEDTGNLASASAFAEVVNRDNKNWNTYPTIEHLGESYGERVVAEYKEQLDYVEDDLFSSVKSNKIIKRGLRNVVKSMYCKDWFAPPDRSWLVFAGLGDAEAFPVLQEYRVGSVAAGRLRWVNQIQREIHICDETNAGVAPFGQREMIDMFYRGIHSDIEANLSKIVVASLTRFKPEDKGDHEPDPALVERVEAAVRQSTDEQVDNYQGPLLEAVAALPRHDLAKMAEALVSLTAFKARMSAADVDTVGGPIDVAMISKGDGFVWVKRKDPLRSGITLNDNLLL